MSNFKEQVDKASLKEASKIFEKKTSSEFQILKHSAEVLVAETDDLTHMYKVALEKGQYENLANKSISVYQAMRADENFTQRALSLQHNFEKSLNSFLNRKVYISYVLPNGEVLVGGEETIAKIYAAAGAQFGRGNISAGKIDKELFESRDKAILSLQAQYKKSVDARKEVYTTALERYKAKYGDPGVPTTKKNKHYIKTYWWYIKSRQTKSFGWTNPINNIGDIAEGYIDVVVHENPQVSNQNIEESLEVLWHHIKRNNTPAIIREDVSLVSDKGEIQFAVKSGSFSTASFGQYYRFAKNILELDFLTAEDLQNNEVFKGLISSRTDTSQKIIKSIKEKYLEELDFDTI